MYKDLTIIIPVFNRGQYLSKALDSILQQQTEYTYQIMICDDASTDNSLAIAKKYRAKFPDKILLLRHDVNKGLYINISRAYTECKSPYFCVLDPDDYWTDPLKIQMALSFLNKNPSYTIFMTNTTIQQNGKQDRLYVGCSIEKNFDLDDYFHGDVPLSQTTGGIYRNIFLNQEVLQKFVSVKKKYMQDVIHSDSFRNLLCLTIGTCHYTPNSTAVYNITGDGMWTSMTSFEQHIENALFNASCFDYFDKKYPELLHRSVDLLCLGKQQFERKYLDIDIQKATAIFQKIYWSERLVNDAKCSINFPISIPNKQPTNISFKNKMRLQLYFWLREKLLKKGLIE